MIFLYIYAKFHWKYHTFDRYYSCSSTKLRHKTQQKVWKCSLAFPLKDGIFTFYVSFTIKYIQSITEGVVASTPGYPWYFRYNF